MRSASVALLCALLLYLPQPAAGGGEASDQAVLGALNLPAAPTISPSQDETAVHSDGNWETDALLECYARFKGPGDTIGPPHISSSAKFGYILRADFVRQDHNAQLTDRLVCSRNGFETHKDLSIPHLDAPGITVPDAANQRLVDGWLGRKRAAAIARSTARRLSSPDAQTVRQLEGVWLVGKKPDKGPCVSQWYLNTHIEFEFQKSHGRALIFEPYDRWTAIAISGIEKTGDTLSIQAETRDGGLSPFMNVRTLGPGRIELIHPVENGPVQPNEIAYRCGDPDQSVTGSVAADVLNLLSPNVSGGWSAPVAVEGASDDDICQGQAREKAKPGSFPKHRTIQFELYGPVHYWIMAWDFWPEHKIAFDFIRSIRQIDDHTLKLTMQEHLEKGDGWDVPESRGKTYELTIILKGSHFEIPELSASFVRCKPQDVASVGMGPM